MSEEISKNLPSVIEVAAEIFTAAYNSARIVKVSEEELREVSRREKLREGFKVALWARLTDLGAEVKQAGSLTYVSVPSDSAISLRKAKEKSAEAQDTGIRETHDGLDTAVVRSN